MTTYRQTMSTALESVRIIQEGVILERQLSDTEIKRREVIAQDLPDSDFKDRYGARWKEVKMAVATKQAKNESLHPKEEISEAGGFSPAMIKKLKKAYSTLNRVDPTSPAGKKMPALLDKMDKDQLIQIVKADIKFLSLLAVNRLIRDHGMRADAIRKLKEDSEDFKFNQEEIDFVTDKVVLVESEFSAMAYGKKDQRFVVKPRDTSGMAGKQDKFKMYVVQLDNMGREKKVIKDLGSHVSIGAAQKFAKNKGIIEDVELDEAPWDASKTHSPNKQTANVKKLRDKNKKQPVFKGTPAQIKQQMKDWKKKNDKVKIGEGTWKMPKNKKQIAPLLKLMRKPVKLGKDGDDAVDVVKPYIGDDELYDDLYAAGKKNPNGDARPAIRDALQRFGLSWEEEVEIGEGYQVYVKSPTAKSGWIPQGQPHKSEADAKKDAKNFRGATRVINTKIGWSKKEEVELDEGPLRKRDRYKIYTGKTYLGKEWGKDKKEAKENALEKGGSATNWKTKLSPNDLKAIKEEVDLDEAKYDLYHKDFSSAMQHAYKAAKKMYGITVDPKEIDDKVATGPRKPSEGKTNKYRLKGDKGGIQIQVYNKGGSKPYELNMYKEEFVKEGYMELEFKDKRKAIQAFNYINNKIWAGGHPPYDDFNQEGSSLQIDTDGNLNRRNDMLKDLKALPKDLKFKVVVNEGFAEARQLKDKKKEMLVKSKTSGVKVIDKADWAIYKKKGYFQVEDTEVIEQWEKKLKKVRGNTPGAEGIRGAIEDDIAREKEKKNPNKKLIESELDEGKMSQLHQHIKDKKSPEEIAKLMKLDVKTIKALMSSYNFPPNEAYEIGTDEYRKYLEDLTPMEGARSDAMRAMKKDKDFNKKDTADDDDHASASDRKAASKNVFSQLLKSVDSGGKIDIVFRDKKKVKVSAAIAKQVIKKSQSFRRPNEKLEFQSKIQTSYRDLLKALKEDNNKPLTILDRIDAKIKEKKNG